MEPKLRFKEFSGDWEEKKLGDIADIVGGGTPSTEIDSYWKGNIQWFTPSEIGKKYISNSDRTITELGLKNSSAKLLPKGTILLSSRATLGEMSILQREGCTNQGFQSLIVKNKYNNEFIFYCQPCIKKYCFIHSSGSTFLEISKTQLSKCKLKIPSLSEQTKIADFLSTVDKKIQNQQDKITHLENIKKGFMQKIFSRKIRFKDDNGNEFPEWEEKKIKEIFNITRGYVLSINNVVNYVNGEYIYPVYSSQTKDKGLLGYYNEYLYEDAITWTTDGANAGTVQFRKGKFYCTNVCGVLINEHGYSNKCIAEMINRISKKYVSYVGNPKLMNNVMAEIPIEFPSILEQQKIADFLSSFDEKIDIEKETLDHLKELKKGLLQQMFI